MAEFALETINQPIGVSTYQVTRELPGEKLGNMWSTVKAALGRLQYGQRSGLTFSVHSGITVLE